MPGERAEAVEAMASAAGRPAVRLLNTEQFALGSLIPLGTVKRERTAGRILPAFPAKGGDRWEEMQVYGWRVGRGLWRRGVVVDDCCGVAGFLSGLTVEQLLARFADGRCCIAVVGNRAAARLVAPEALLDNPLVDLKAAAAAAMPLYAVDIRPVWEAVRAEVDRLLAAGK